jgi:uncharacterized protein with FMN-binding domain
MISIINITAAWLSALLTVFLLAQFLLRRAFKQDFRRKAFFTRLHKLFGIIIIFTGLTHGVLSEKPVLSLNFGSMLLLVFILLFLSFVLRKRFKFWFFAHRALSVFALVLFVCHMGEYAVNRLPFLSGETYGYTLMGDNVQSNFNARFNDGVYVGVAKGYGEDLTVEILIENNILKRIDVLSHNEEDAKFFMPAFETMPERIVKSQSLDVDTVSGATFSCTGLINAVRDALKKALTEGVLPDIKPLPR